MPGYHNSVIDLLYNKLVELSTSQSLIRSIVSDTMLGALLTHSGYTYKARFTADDPQYTDTMPLLGMAIDLLYEDTDNSLLEPMNAEELLSFFSQELPHYVNKLVQLFPSLRTRIR